MAKQNSAARARALWALCIALLAAYCAAMGFLHWKQMMAAFAGDGKYDSDLVMHLAQARSGDGVYSLVSLALGWLWDNWGRGSVAVFFTLCQLAIVLAFSLGLRGFVPQWPRPARLLVSLAVNLSAAVWVPRGGKWYIGTVTGTVYHNITYTIMAPFALLTMLAFFRLWASARAGGRPDARAWLGCTVCLALATACKTSFAIAFAPALLGLLVWELCAARGRNLKNEIVVGCTVLPSIAVAAAQVLLLYTEEDGSSIVPIFTVDFDPAQMPWGPFNYAGVLGLARSLVFPVVMLVLFWREAWGSFRVRFAVWVFAVALAEGLLLVESGDRLYHANLWWGGFVCMLVLFEELTGLLLRQWAAPHGRLGTVRLLAAAGALAWHVVSGVCFLVLLLQGQSYNIAILTYHIGPFGA